MTVMEAADGPRSALAGVEEILDRGKPSLGCGTLEHAAVRIEGITVNIGDRQVPVCFANLIDEFLDSRQIAQNGVEYNPSFLRDLWIFAEKRAFAGTWPASDEDDDFLSRLQQRAPE